jgi:DNA invertase Pin-like site-specific DNA recombinase
MSVAYGYVRACTHPKVLTSQDQMDEIDRAYQDKCHGVPWGGFFEDSETSVRLPLAKRKAGRELLGRLKPGDHLFVTRAGRAFRSLRDLRARLENWIDRGIKVHLLDCPGGVDTSTAEGAKLALQTLMDVADFKRAVAGERKADREMQSGKWPGLTD